jgi:hypothetical protein
MRRLSEAATLIVTHNITVRAVDAGDVAALVMLDLNAAFDTVDHAVNTKTGVLVFTARHLRGSGRICQTSRKLCQR